MSFGRDAGYPDNCVPLCHHGREIHCLECVKEQREEEAEPRKPMTPEADALIRSLREKIVEEIDDIRLNGQSEGLSAEDIVEYYLRDLVAAVLDRPAPPPHGLFLTDAQIEQVMNALEGWQGIDAQTDEARRKAAFEMIQELGEPAESRPAPPPEDMEAELYRLAARVVHQQERCRQMPEAGPCEFCRNRVDFARLCLFHFSAASRPAPAPDSGIE